MKDDLMFNEDAHNEDDIGIADDLSNMSLTDEQRKKDTERMMGFLDQTTEKLNTVKGILSKVSKYSDVQKRLRQTDDTKIQQKAKEVEALAKKVADLETRYEVGQKESANKTFANPEDLVRGVDKEVQKVLDNFSQVVGHSIQGGSKGRGGKPAYFDVDEVLSAFDSVIDIYRLPLTGQASVQTTVFGTAKQAIASADKAAESKKLIASYKTQMETLTKTIKTGVVPATSTSRGMSKNDLKKADVRRAQLGKKIVAAETERKKALQEQTVAEDKVKLALIDAETETQKNLEIREKAETDRIKAAAKVAVAKDKAALTKIKSIKDQERGQYWADIQKAKSVQRQKLAAAETEPAVAPAQTTPLDERLYSYWDPATKKMKKVTMESVKDALKQGKAMVFNAVSPDYSDFEHPERQVYHFGNTSGVEGSALEKAYGNAKSVSASALASAVAPDLISEKYRKQDARLKELQEKQRKEGTLTRKDQIEYDKLKTQSEESSGEGTALHYLGKLQRDALASGKSWNAKTNWNYLKSIEGKQDAIKKLPVDVQRLYQKNLKIRDTSERRFFTKTSILQDQVNSGMDIYSSEQGFSMLLPVGGQVYRINGTFDELDKLMDQYVYHDTKFRNAKGKNAGVHKTEELLQGSMGRLFYRVLAPFLGIPADTEFSMGINQYDEKGVERSRNISTFNDSEMLDFLSDLMPMLGTATPTQLQGLIKKYPKLNAAYMEDQGTVSKERPIGIAHISNVDKMAHLGTNLRNLPQRHARYSSLMARLGGSDRVKDTVRKLFATDKGRLSLSNDIVDVLGDVFEGRTLAQMTRDPKMAEQFLSSFEAIGQELAMSPMTTYNPIYVPGHDFSIGSLQDATTLSGPSELHSQGSKFFQAFQTATEDEKERLLQDAAHSLNSETADPSLYKKEYWKMFGAQKQSTPGLGQLLNKIYAKDAAKKEAVLRSAIGGEISEELFSQLSPQEQYTLMARRLFAKLSAEKAGITPCMDRTSLPKSYEEILDFMNPKGLINRTDFYKNGKFGKEEEENYQAALRESRQETEDYFGKDLKEDFVDAIEDKGLSSESAEILFDQLVGEQSDYGPSASDEEEKREKIAFKNQQEATGEQPVGEAPSNFRRLLSTTFDMFNSSKEGMQNLRTIVRGGASTQAQAGIKNARESLYSVFGGSGGLSASLRNATPSMIDATHKKLDSIFWRIDADKTMTDEEKEYAKNILSNQIFGRNDIRDLPFNLAANMTNAMISPSAQTGLEKLTDAQLGMQTVGSSLNRIYTEVSGDKDFGQILAKSKTPFADKYLETVNRYFKELMGLDPNKPMNLDELDIDQLLPAETAGMTSADAATRAEQRKLLGLYRSYSKMWGGSAEGREALNNQLLTRQDLSSYLGTRAENGESGYSQLALGYPIGSFHKRWEYSPNANGGEGGNIFSGWVPYPNIAHEVAENANPFYNTLLGDYSGNKINDYQSYINALPQDRFAAILATKKTEEGTVDPALSGGVDIPGKQPDNGHQEPPSNGQKADAPNLTTLVVSGNITVNADTGTVFVNGGQGGISQGPTSGGPRDFSKKAKPVVTDVSEKLSSEQRGAISDYRSIIRDQSSYRNEYLDIQKMLASDRRVNTDARTRRSYQDRAAEIKQLYDERTQDAKDWEATYGEDAKSNPLMKEAVSQTLQNAGLANTRKDAQRLTKENGATTLFQNLKTSFHGLLNQFVQFGAAYKILGLVREGIQNVVTSATNLDKAMTNIRIVTGDSREEAVKYMKSLSGLAGQLGVTTTEVASGVNEWLRQGYSISDVNKLVTDSTHLSILGMISSSEATSDLTAIVKGYKLSVNEAAAAVDKLTSLDLASASSAGGIAQALQQVANTAHNAGVSLDQVSSMIATISDVTQREPSSVGQSL